MSLRQHIAELADETGIDWPPVKTHQSIVEYRGRVIDVWYDENSASVFAWKAFVMGLGTFSGAGDDEAIDGAKAAIDKVTA